LPTTIRSSLRLALLKRPTTSPTSFIRLSGTRTGTVGSSYRPYPGFRPVPIRRSYHFEAAVRTNIGFTVVRDGPAAKHAFAGYNTVFFYRKVVLCEQRTALQVDTAVPPVKISCSRLELIENQPLTSVMTNERSSNTLRSLCKTCVREPGVPTGPEPRWFTTTSAPAATSGIAR
jgi:hypothetical protein